VEGGGGSVRSIMNVACRFSDRGFPKSDLPKSYLRIKAQESLSLSLSLSLSIFLFGGA
jgi:hypothetical protein